MFRIRLARNGKRTFKIVFNMPVKTKTGIRQGFIKFGSLLQKSLKSEILRKPKSGREYLIRRGGRRFRHIAAADGETPANITGRLRRSVDYKVHGASKMEFGYDNSVDYGHFLEDGTSKMGAKTGIQNAIKEEKLQGLKLMRNEIIKRWNE